MVLDRAVREGLYNEATFKFRMRGSPQKVGTGVGADSRQKPTNKRIRLKNNCKSWKSFLNKRTSRMRRKHDWVLPTVRHWQSMCLCHFSPRRSVYHSAWMIGLRELALSTSGGCAESTSLIVLPCESTPVLVSSFLRISTRNTEKLSESPRLVRIISLETGNQL